MTDSAEQPLVAILQHCSAAAPEPWYPSVHAQAHGIERDSLDPYLERLRLAGLIHLTDWVQGTGQGYRLTTEGQELLQNPRGLSQLQQGKLPQVWITAAPAEPATERLTPYERGEIILGQPLGERTTPLVTIFLLLANVGNFVYGLSLAQQDRLLDEYLWSSNIVGVWDIQLRLGALNASEVAQGDWWRLLSACFVHLGVIHLGVNMYTLYVIGPLVEQLWGRGRFLLIYLICGLAGSCAMLVVDPKVGGAGASRALWGIMASYAAWIFLNRQHLPGRLNPRWLSNLLMVFLINIGISLMPGISASAHFGGGIMGLVVAVLVNYQRFASGTLRWLAALGIALLPVGCVGALGWQMHTDPRWLVIERRAQDQQYRRLYARFSPTAKAELEDPLRVYNEEVKEVMERGVERRDPADVAKARSAIAQQQQRLATLARSLDKTGPYTNADVEATRQTALTVIASAVEFYRLADVCLQPDEDTKRAEKELAQQKTKLETDVAVWKSQWTDFCRVMGVRD